VLLRQWRTECCTSNDLGQLCHGNACRDNSNPPSKI
jgi:hypothetical protein